MKRTTLRERWLARLGLLVLTVAFADLVAWYRAGQYDPLDWAAVIVVEAALLLAVVDFMVRWHTDTRFTVLIASGVFGVVHGTLITLGAPSDLPLSLVIFGTGMPALMFLLAYLSFHLLFGGREPSRQWWVVAPAVGLLHGLWLRWLPALDEVEFAGVELGAVLPLSVVVLAGVAVSVFVLPLPAQLEREDWLLTPLEWVLVAIPLLVVVVLRLQSGALELFPLLLAVLIVAVLIALMWFYHSLVPRPDFVLRFRPRNTLTIRWLLALIPFALLAWVGYELPGENTPLQFTLLFGAIIAFGISWPPLVSIAVSVQAFIELSRQEY